jgi:hypothetical protein
MANRNRMQRRQRKQRTTISRQAARVNRFRAFHKRLQNREEQVRKLTVQQVDPVQLNAAYDYAELNTDLNELFARAHHESGLSSLDPQARRTLIDRSRYEIHQANPWLKGAARSAVTWVIGRGPFLEVKLSDRRAAQEIERKFNQWMKHTKTARKLRAMAYAKITDGSGLSMIVNNPNVRGPVKLDHVPFEDEQIQSPPGHRPERGQDWNVHYLLDGKELDAAQNPIAYWITSEHPADVPTADPVRVSAEYVIDVWAWERPSQRRGNPELGTSVGSGPMQRIYERAVLDAAATAAKHTVLVETNVDRFSDGESVYQPVETAVEMPIGYGMQTFLPAGHKASQLKAEQPTTTHHEFVRTNVAGASRPLGQPGQISTGDASGLNFASGQLGRQDYENDIDVQRQDWELECLDKLLQHWLIEAALIGEIDIAYRDIDEVSHEWRWTRRRHQDTNREYSGRRTACEAGLTSPAFWMEDDGVDPEQEDEAAARSYGVTVEQFRRARFLQLFGDAGAAAIGAPPITQRGSQSETESESDAEDTEEDDESDDSETDSERGGN